MKLAHVLWRKIVPEDLENADTSLNSVCFDLLKVGNYDLAGTILEFAMALPRHNSSLNRRLYVVNRAIAYKFGDHQEECLNLLNKEDWSDCGENFQLAKSVLEDRFDDAVSIMKSLGVQAKGIGRFGYQTFPLFREFRKSSLFLEAYNGIFGEPFKIASEQKISPVGEIPSLSLASSTPIPPN